AISRISDMLKAKDKFTVDDFKTMLMDTHSLMAKKVAPILVKLQPADPRAQQAAQMLGAWDANVSANSAAAAIYEVTVQDALSETFSDELGGDLFGEYLDSAGRTTWRAFELLLDKPD